MTAEQDTNLDSGQRFILNRTFTAPQIIEPTELLLDQLSLNGAGSAYSLAVDGSSNAQDFRYVVPSGKILIMLEVEFVLIDVGVEPQLFGGLAALTNGLEFSLRRADDTALVDLVPAGRPIKDIADFAHIGATSLAISQTGGTEDMVIANYRLRETHGYTTYLLENQYVQVLVNDNLTDLTKFEVVVTGRLIDDE